VNDQSITHYSLLLKLFDFEVLTEVPVAVLILPFVAVELGVYFRSAVGVIVFPLEDVHTGEGENGDEGE
jgi:hypothetical protein